MKNLQSELEKLEKEYLQEVKGTKIKWDAIEKTGIENVIYYNHTNGLGFGYSEPISSIETVKKIVAAFPIDQSEETNFNLTFAGREPIETDSSLVIKWDSEIKSQYNNVFKITYTSNGLKIDISVPHSYFAKHTYYDTKQGKHRGFGNYDTERFIFLDYFYTQKYSGGSCVLYFLEGAESLEEYLNFALTGEFKYKNEI